MEGVGVKGLKYADNGVTSNREAGSAARQAANGPYGAPKGDFDFQHAHRTLLGHGRSPVMP